MNFLFSVKKIKCNSVLKLTLVLLLCSTFGCESIKTRQSLKQINKSKDSEKLESETIEEPPLVEVKEKKLPKLGVILGPGSLRSVAQSGFLYSLEQNKIPIASLIGHEWGALIGGYYASLARASEVQWQLNKMEKGQLGSVNFLSKTYEQKKIEDYLSKILKKDILDRDMSSTPVPFACPTISYVVGQTIYKRGGSLKSLLERCMPYPPLFEPSGVWFADAFSIEKSVRYMKQQKVDLIVYVNVLGEGDLFDKKIMKNHPASAVLWQQLSNHSKDMEALKGKYPELRVVHISTSKQPLFEVKNMNLLTLAGKRAGDDFVEYLQKEFGF